MNELIAYWAEYASLPLADDGVITYWMSPNMTPNSRRDLLWTYNRLDDVLPIDVTRVSSQQHAEIHNYAWGEEFTPSGNWAGYAQTRWDSDTNSYDWNIHVKEYQSNYSRILALHEVGHVLGLEHPFESNDGDVWNNATHNDTVMAYAGTSNTILDYRRADWDTITGLYGGIIPDIIEPSEPPPTPTEPTPTPTPTPTPQPIFNSVTLLPRQERKLSRVSHTRKATRLLIKWGVVDNVSHKDYNKDSISSIQRVALTNGDYEGFINTLTARHSTGCCCPSHSYPHSHITD